MLPPLCGLILLPGAVVCRNKEPSGRQGARLGERPLVDCIIGPMHLAAPVSGTACGRHNIGLAIYCASATRETQFRIPAMLRQATCCGRIVTGSQWELGTREWAPMAKRPSSWRNGTIAELNPPDWHPVPLSFQWKPNRSSRRGVLTTHVPEAARTSREALWPCLGGEGTWEASAKWYIFPKTAHSLRQSLLLLLLALATFPELQFRWYYSL